MRHPSYLIVRRLKIMKISPTRPENTAKLLSWEYQKSLEQHQIYTRAHENNHSNAPSRSQYLLVAIATTR